MQKTRDRGANALKQDLVVRVEATSRATTETVYAVLADLSSHTVWAGERQGKTHPAADDRRARRARPPSAPSSTPRGRTRWARSRIARSSRRRRRGRRSSSSRRHGSRRRRASRPTGRTSSGTSSSPTVGGCRIVCTSRVTRISELPGMLGALQRPWSPRPRAGGVGEGQPAVGPESRPSGGGARRRRVKRWRG